MTQIQQIGGTVALSKQSGLSKNNKPKPKNSGNATLNIFHLHGIAKRMAIKVDDLPVETCKKKSSLEGFTYPENDKGEIKPYELLSQHTAAKLKPNGASLRTESLRKIMRLVNAEMDRNNIPSWIPKLEMEWFFTENPDQRWRQHIPDYANWDDLINTENQQSAEGIICGLYYLYRPHGRERVDRKGKGAQRELLCIHPPVDGHIRVHRINEDGKISSGLGYKEGQLFTTALYRKAEDENLKSSFLIIKGPYKKPKAIMRGVITRITGEGVAYASGALLVRIPPTKISVRNQKHIRDHLRLLRARDNFVFTLPNKPTTVSEKQTVKEIEKFRHFETRAEISWKDPEMEQENILPHVKYLREAIFRLDNNLPKQLD